MPLDTKHEALESLRINRAEMAKSTGPSPRGRIAIFSAGACLVVLGISLIYRFASNPPLDVEVAYAMAQGGDSGSVVLTASGYIVPHHMINVNSKVTGRVKWVGVEKGDAVKEGQVLVRLEDDEFRAQYEQAVGMANSARAYLEELEHGSRPEEIAQAQHNLDEARATLNNDKLTLERTRQLFSQGIVAKQVLDDATAKFESDQQRVNSLDKARQLTTLGPRVEEIARARGALVQAQGQAAYARSLLEATAIRAPVSGIILDRTAEKGELITAQFASAAQGGPQGSVVTMADLSDIQADLDIAQVDFAKLTPHQKAEVRIDAFPDRKYEGVLAEISPQANRQKATVEVKVQVLNSDSYLRPEMNTTVHFLAIPSASSSQAAGAFVPATALHEKDGATVVFLAFNGKAIQRVVQVVSRRSDSVLVRGLNGGETVIITASQALKDGNRIRIKGQS